MFSKELENLIQATLEDGVLEEHEKAAIIKRAEREGVDIAELEIYINSLLQKRARELENEKNAVRKQAEKEKKEAFGRKCPNCGAQVPPLALKCECGYEFTKKEAVSSVQTFFKKLEECSGRKKIETIKMFPVPNTKEDVIEFLSMAAPNSKPRVGFIWGTKLGRLILSVIVLALVLFAYIYYFWDSSMDYSEDDKVMRIVGLFIAFFFTAGIMLGICSEADTDAFHDYELAKAWRAKFDQVMMKGRSLRGDAEFTHQLDYYEGKVK